MSASRIAIALVLLGTSVAFGTPMRGVAQEDEQGPTVEVAVQNDAVSGAHVYVLQEGHLVPLGFVEAAGNETFTIPPVLVGTAEPIHLVADALRSTDWYKSDAVAVRPGNALAFTIARDLNRSTVTVRD